MDALGMRAVTAWTCSATPGIALVVWCCVVVVYRKSALEHLRGSELGVAAAWAALGLLGAKVGGELGPAAGIAHALVMAAGAVHVHRVNIVGPPALEPGDATSMDGKVAVVTGVSVGGIGFDTALNLARLGAHVVLACRSEAKGRAAEQLIKQQVGPSKVSFVPLDLASFKSVHQFAKAVSAAHPKVDILINNAGMMTPERAETQDGYESTLQVNCLAPFLLTMLLLPQLRKASAQARVVFVNSSVHKACEALGGLDLANANLTTGYGMFRAYAQSKFMVLALANELASRLERHDRGETPLESRVQLAFPSARLEARAGHAPLSVTVNSVMPGTIATSITRDLPLWAQLGHHYVISALVKNCEQGSRTTTYAAAARALDGLTGGYYEHCSLAPPHRNLGDAQMTQAIWDWADEVLARSAPKIA